MTFQGMLEKVYLRTSPRLPKVIALAVLLDHLSRTGQKLPQIVMARIEDQTPGEGVYQLDCGPNEYRERGFPSELDTVIRDFGIAEDQTIKELVHLVRTHNKSERPNPDQIADQQAHGRRPKLKPHFHLNSAWGSVGYLSGACWSLIEAVPPGHWRLAKQAAEGDQGELLLDPQTGRPKFFKTDKADWLTEDDFLGMCLDVVTAYIKARREEAKRPWTEGEKVLPIRTLLNATFIGPHDLKRPRALKAGGGSFPTLNRYIQDLWTTGSDYSEIRNRLRPWLRLWELCGDCYIDADILEPMEWFQVGQHDDEKYFGVVFDLTQDKSPAAENNPLIHQVWLSKILENVHVVIVRRETGHTAIFARPMYAERMADLAGMLQMAEPGLWHYQGGFAIYNGSYSRVDQTPTRIPLTGLGSIVYMAESCLSN